jgi:hypothetical protein
MTSLETVLETYLCDDLRALCATRVGYPILSTAFAGIELLGALLSPKAFSPFAGGDYFQAFWSTHLYPGTKAEDRAKAIYKLARHGVAHQFFLKGEISLMSGEYWQHLTYDGAVLWIDTHALAADLIKSYHAAVKPLLANPTSRATLDLRFHEIIAAGKADSSKLGLSTCFPTTPPRPTPPSAAQGATGAVTSSIKP